MTVSKVRFGRQYSGDVRKTASLKWPIVEKQSGAGVSGTRCSFLVQTSIRVEFSCVGTDRTEEKSLVHIKQGRCDSDLSTAT